MKKRKDLSFFDEDLLRIILRIFFQVSRKFLIEKKILCIVGRLLGIKEDRKKVEKFFFLELKKQKDLPFFDEDLLRIILRIFFQV